MNLSHYTEFPPPDFVAFLAQRIGVSHEDAETRLERWLGEYHSSTGQRHERARADHSASLSL